MEGENTTSLVLWNFGGMFHEAYREKKLTFPRHPGRFSDNDCGVSVKSPPCYTIYRFQYHSQKVIGSLGIVQR